MGVAHLDAATVIRAQQVQNFAPRHDNLMDLLVREVTVHSRLKGWIPSPEGRRGVVCRDHQQATGP